MGDPARSSKEPSRPLWGTDALRLARSGLLTSVAKEREYVGELARAVQEATGESVELAYVDQGYSGERAAREATAYGGGMRLEIAKHEEAKRGFV